MPEMDLAKLEARLYDLRQNINDTAIADCKRYGNSNFYVGREELNRSYLLLDKMVVIAGDINVTVNRYLSLIKEGINLSESYKKLLKEYTLVKDE